MPDLLQTFLIALTGGLASGVTGIVGLSITQRYTDNRKLIDATLSELEAVVEACSTSSSAAWRATGDPQSLAVSETICLLHEISSYISFIKVRVPGAALRLDSAHLNFRRKASGDNFDVTGRAPDAGRVGEVRSAKAALKMACRSVIFERNRFHLPFIA